MLYNHAKFCIAGVEMPVSDVIQVSGGLLTTRLSFVLTDKEAYLASPMARSRYEDVPVRLYISKPFNTIPDSISDSDYITVFDGSASLTLAYNPVTRQLDIGVTARPGSVAALNSIIYSELSIGLLASAQTAAYAAVNKDKTETEGTEVVATGVGLNDLNSILFLKRIAAGTQAMDISRPTDILDFTVSNLLTYARARAGSSVKSLPYVNEANPFVTNNVDGYSTLDKFQAFLIDSGVKRSLYEPTLAVPDMIMRYSVLKDLEAVSSKMNAYWKSLSPDPVHQPDPGFMESIYNYWSDKGNSIKSELLTSIRNFVYDDPETVNRNLAAYSSEIKDMVKDTFRNLVHYIRFDSREEAVNSIWADVQPLSSLWTREEAGKKSDQITVYSKLPDAFKDKIRYDLQGINDNAGVPDFIFGEVLTPPNSPELITIFNSYIKSFLLFVGLYSVQDDDGKFVNLLSLFFTDRQKVKSEYLKVLQSELYDLINGGLEEFLEEVINVFERDTMALAEAMISVEQFVSEHLAQTNNLAVKKARIVASACYPGMSSVENFASGSQTYSWEHMRNTGVLLWTSPATSESNPLSSLESNSALVSAWSDLVHDSVVVGLSFGRRIIQHVQAKYPNRVVQEEVLPTLSDVSNVPQDVLPLSTLISEVKNLLKAYYDADLANNENYNPFDSTRPNLFDIKAASKILDYTVYNKLGTLDFMRVGLSNPNLCDARIYPHLKLTQLQELQRLVAGAAASRQVGVCSLFEILHKLTGDLHLSLYTPLNKAVAQQDPMKPFLPGENIDGLSRHESVTELMLLPTTEMWCVPKCNVFYRDVMLPSVMPYNSTINVTKIIIKYDPPVASLPGGQTGTLAVPSRYYQYDLLNPGKIVEWEALGLSDNKVYTASGDTYTEEYKAAYIYDMYKTDMVSIDAEAALLFTLCYKPKGNSPSELKDTDDVKNYAPNTALKVSSKQLSDELAEVPLSKDKVNVKFSIVTGRTKAIGYSHTSAKDVAGRFTAAADEESIKKKISNYDYIYNASTNTLEYIGRTESIQENAPDGFLTWKMFYAACFAQIALSFANSFEQQLRTAIADPQAFNTVVSNNMKFITSSNLTIEFTDQVASYLIGYLSHIDAIRVVESQDSGWFKKKKDGYSFFLSFVEKLAAWASEDEINRFLTDSELLKYLQDSPVDIEGAVDDGCYIGPHPEVIHKQFIDISLNEHFQKIVASSRYSSSQTSKTAQDLIASINQHGEELSIGITASNLVSASPVTVWCNIYRLLFSGLYASTIYAMAYRQVVSCGLAKTLPTIDQQVPKKLLDKVLLQYVTTLDTDRKTLSVSVMRQPYSAALKKAYPNELDTSSELADQILTEGASDTGSTLNMSGISELLPGLDAIKALAPDLVNVWVSVPDKLKEFNLYAELWDPDTAEVNASTFSESLKAHLSSRYVTYLTTQKTWLTLKQGNSEQKRELYTEPYFIVSKGAFGSSNKPIPQLKSISFSLNTSFSTNEESGRNVTIISQYDAVGVGENKFRWEKDHYDNQEAVPVIIDAELESGVSQEDTTKFPMGPSLRDAKLTNWPFIVWFATRGKKAAIINYNMVTGGFDDLHDLSTILGEPVLKQKKPRVEYFDLAAGEDPLTDYYPSSGVGDVLQLIKDKNPWTRQGVSRTDLLDDYSYVIYPVPLTEDLKYYIQAMNLMHAQVIKYYFNDIQLYDPDLSPIDVRSKISSTVYDIFTRKNLGKTLSLTPGNEDEIEGGDTVKESESGQTPESPSEDQLKETPGVNALLSGTAAVKGDIDKAMLLLFGTQYNPNNPRLGGVRMVDWENESWEDPYNKTGVKYYKGAPGGTHWSTMEEPRWVSKNGKTATFRLHGGTDAALIYSDSELPLSAASRNSYQPYKSTSNKVQCLAPYDCFVVYGVESVSQKVGGDVHTQFSGHGLYAIILPAVDNNYSSWQKPDIPLLMYAHLDPVLTFDLLNKMSNSVSVTHGDRSLESLKNNVSFQNLVKFNHGITKSKEYWFAYSKQDWNNPKRDEYFTLLNKIRKWKPDSKDKTKRNLSNFLPIVIKVTKGNPIGFIGASGAGGGWHVHINYRAVSYRANAAAFNEFYENLIIDSVYPMCLIKSRFDVPIPDNDIIQFEDLAKVRDSNADQLVASGFGNVLNELVKAVTYVTGASDNDLLKPSTPSCAAQSNLTVSSIAEGACQLPDGLLLSIAETTAYKESVRRLCSVQLEPVTLPYYDPYIMDGNMPGAVVYRNDMILTKVMQYAVTIVPNGMIRSLVTFAPGISVMKMLPLYLETMLTLRNRYFKTEDIHEHEKYAEWVDLTVYPFHSLNFFNAFAYSKKNMDQQYEHMFGQKDFVFDWRKVVFLKLNGTTSMSVYDIVATQHNVNGDLLAMACKLDYSQYSHDVTFDLSQVFQGVGRNPINEASLMLDGRSWLNSNLYTEATASTNKYTAPKSRAFCVKYTENQSDYEAQAKIAMNNPVATQPMVYNIPTTFYDWSALFKRLRKTVITPKNRFR